MFFRKKDDPEIRIKIDSESEGILKDIFGINPVYYDEGSLQETASAGKRVYRLSYRVIDVKVTKENGNFTVHEGKEKLPVKPDRIGRKRISDMLQKGENRFRLQVLGGDYKIFLCDHDYNNQFYPVYDRREKYEGILIPE